MIILNNKNEKIQIKIEDEKIEKDINLNNRLIYTSKEYDTSIIEIKEKDNINNFLELDEGIINSIIHNKNDNTKYQDETIYIIQYPEGHLSVSYGILQDIFEDKPYNFLHKSSTRNGSSGSPVINLMNKVIGIHKKGYDKKYNEGTFLDYPIKEFISKYYIEHLNNEIILKKELPIELNNTDNLLNINDKEENDIIKENPIINKEYKLIKKLAEGDFANIYLGSNIFNNELVVVKVESTESPIPTLRKEANFLNQLVGIGIPKKLCFCNQNLHNFLVEPLLGKSLFDIFKEQGRFTLSDICIISLQIIDRIQLVHSKGLIHGDIKPDNFLIGRNDKNVIYLIDFGLSKKYKDNKGNHINFCSTKKFLGTAIFSSDNALRGFEQSRRDDLESIAYMIIYFMKGILPWQKITGLNTIEKCLNIYKARKNIGLEILCNNLPKQILEFIKYVKNLEFGQEPDYNYLRRLINTMIKEIKIFKLNSLILSWNKFPDKKYSKNQINPLEKKSSMPERFHHDEYGYEFKESFNKNIIKKGNKANLSFDNDINYKTNKNMQKNDKYNKFNTVAINEINYEDINFKISKADKKSNSLGNLKIITKKFLEDEFNSDF